MPPRPAGLILAGGLGSRMGTSVPKPLLSIAGTSPFAVALARLAGRCDPVLVGTADRTSFAGFGHEIVPDLRPERLGPLAGLEAAHAWLRRSNAEATHLVTLPGDTPFLPPDLVPRLLDGPTTRPRIALCAGRHHPTVAVWPLAALEGLTAHLNQPDRRLSVLAFLERCGFDTAEFAADSNAPDGDPFFNVNTPADLERAQDCARPGGGLIRP